MLVSCLNDTNQEAGKFNSDTIKGHWRCKTSDGYNELQISDSLYYYIYEGDYIGPVIPIPYKIEIKAKYVLGIGIYMTGAHKIHVLRRAQSFHKVKTKAL